MISNVRPWRCLAVALLLGCERPGGEQATEQVVPVAVEMVSRGQVRQGLVLRGDIEAELEVKVFSKIPDRIERYFVDEGDRVRRGDPIAKIASVTVEQAVRQAGAAVEAARAQHANASAELARARRLYEAHGISRQQYEAIQTQHEAASSHLAQAEAALVTAQSQLGDATVCSPIDGLIGTRFLQAGDVASPALPLASVVQMDRVRLRLDATEDDLGKLKVGQRALVRVRSWPDTTFEGRVAKVSPVLDPLTRMAKVDVVVPNPHHRLKPGMYAEAEVTVGVIENTVLVPRRAVLERTALERGEGSRRVVKHSFVYVVDNGRARERTIDVAYLDQTHVAVRGGLEVGERIVVSGQHNLREGVPVLVAGASGHARGGISPVGAGEGD